MLKMHLKGILSVVNKLRKIYIGTINLSPNSLASFVSG